MIETAIDTQIILQDLPKTEIDKTEQIGLRDQLVREKRGYLSLIEKPIASVGQLKKSIQDLEPTPSFKRFSIELADVQARLRANPEMNLQEALNNPGYTLQFKRELLREHYSDPSWDGNPANLTIDRVVYLTLDSAKSLNQLTGERPPSLLKKHLQNILFTKMVGYLLLDNNLSSIELEERVSKITTSISTHIDLLGLKELDDPKADMPEREICSLIGPIINNSLILRHIADLVPLNDSGDIKNNQGIETFFSEDEWDLHRKVDGVAFDSEGNLVAVVQSATASKVSSHPDEPITLKVHRREVPEIIEIEMNSFYSETVDKKGIVAALFGWYGKIDEMRKKIFGYPEKVPDKGLVKKHIHSAPGYPIVQTSSVHPESKFTDFTSEMINSTGPGGELEEDLAGDPDRSPMIVYSVGLTQVKMENIEDVKYCLMSIGSGLREPTTSQI